MPRMKQKPAKPGRNDPCWCGSGRKYKDCHLPIEEAQRAEQRKLRQAQDTLLPKIIEAAQQTPTAFPAALERFWQGKYTVEQMGSLDELEDRGAERFLTWFAFDYRQEDGQTLVERLAQTTPTSPDAAGAGAAASSDATSDIGVDRYEAQLLQQWQPVRLLPYVAEAVQKGQGLILRDLLQDWRYDVEDRSASRRLQVGEVLVGHLVPIGTPLGEPAAPADAAADALPTCTIAGAIAHLTPDTAEKLREFAHLHLEDLRRTEPTATLADLAQARSQIFNHFVMGLPEEHVPGLLDDILLQTRTALQLVGVPLPGAPAPEAEDQALPSGTEPAAQEREP